MDNAALPALLSHLNPVLYAVHVLVTRPTSSLSSTSSVNICQSGLGMYRFNWLSQCKPKVKQLFVMLNLVKLLCGTLLQDSLGHPLPPGLGS